MLLHVSKGRLNLIPCDIDRFSQLLWGGCSMQLKGTGMLQFTQIFVYSPKEIDDRLLLLEHTIQAGF